MPLADELPALFHALYVLLLDHPVGAGAITVLAVLGAVQLPGKLRDATLGRTRADERERDAINHLLPVVAAGAVEGHLDGDVSMWTINGTQFDTETELAETLERFRRYGWLHIGEAIFQERDRVNVTLAGQRVLEMASGPAGARAFVIALRRARRHGARGAA